MDERSEPLSELDPRELDDEAHREELRRRFEMLLQELRVVLPGVQILLAFLLTAPFSSRFAELDGTGRALYGIALAAAATSALALLAPTILHRLGQRRARVGRLIWSTRLFVVGVALLAVSLIGALWCVGRFVYGAAPTWAIMAPAVGALLLLWLVLPLLLHRER